MTLSVKPNFREVGKVFGKNMGEYQNKLSKLSFEDIVRLQNNQNIRRTIGDEEYDITPEMVEIRYTAKEGFNVGMENGNFIILDTRISDELKMEGNAREFVSKVQQLRKDNGFDIADRIITYYNTDEDFENSILNNIDYIKNETLSIKVEKDESLNKDLVLNDYNVGIRLEKK